MTDDEELEKLVGVTVAEARTLGINFRVLIEDGRGTCVTADYRSDRINVHVENGVISKVAGRG